LAGSADTIMVIGRKRHEEAGQLQVTGRDVNEGEYALRFTPAWVLDGDDLAEAAAEIVRRRTTAGVANRMSEVVAHVDGLPQGQTAGPTDVATALDLDQKTAGIYLSRAAASDRITKVGRGRYAPTPDPVGSVGLLSSEDGADPARQQPDTTNTPTGGSEPAPTAAERNKHEPSKGT
jgi:hypothetical protein